MQDYFKFLKDVYFFESLSDEDILKIQSVCREEKFDTGEVIFFEGSIGDRCFIILKGSAEIWKDYNTPERDLLTISHSRQLFGELALIDHFPRSATVIASEPVKLLSIRRKDFDYVLSQSASISASIMRSVSSMIRERTDNFVHNLRTSKRNLQKAYEKLQKEVEERRQLEAQLYQAQKMESIGTLAGGIAHDFNNILCAIFGYTEMAMNSLEKNDVNYQYLNEIGKSAQRAKDLVSQILTFSRQSELEKKPIKIQYIIKEALKLINSFFPATIKIMQNINQDCGPVMANPSQIHQVIMNICTNAFHAMGENNGTLTVNLDMLKIQDKELSLDIAAGSYIRLSVSDTGCGMDSEVKKRIFDPYFTTKPRGKGTGLGMSIVHGIIKKHDGHIMVSSSLGKGSTFCIYLPVLETTKVEQGIVKSESVLTGNEQILLVDDEQQIVQMMKLMLEDLGYKVKARTSSVEAFHAFKAQSDNFDLVITDQTMPNMTGHILAKEILRIRPDIPIILCTGFSEMITQEKINNIGISALVLKPVVRKEIANIIRQVLDFS